MFSNWNRSTHVSRRHPAAGIRALIALGCCCVLLGGCFTTIISEMLPAASTLEIDPSQVEGLWEASDKSGGVVSQVAITSTLGNHYEISGEMSFGEGAVPANGTLVLSVIDGITFASLDFAGSVTCHVVQVDADVMYVSALNESVIADDISTEAILGTHGGSDIGGPVSVVNESMEDFVNYLSSKSNVITGTASITLTRVTSAVVVSSSDGVKDSDSAVHPVAQLEPPDRGMMRRTLILTIVSVTALLAFAFMRRR